MRVNICHHVDILFSCAHAVLRLVRTEKIFMIQRVEPPVQGRWFCSIECFRNLKSGDIMILFWLLWVAVVVVFI